MTFMMVALLSVIIVSCSNDEDDLNNTHEGGIVNFSGETYTLDRLYCRYYKSVFSSPWFSILLADYDYVNTVNLKKYNLVWITVRTPIEVEIPGEGLPTGEFTDYSVEYFHDYYPLAILTGMDPYAPTTGDRYRSTDCSPLIISKKGNLYTFDIEKMIVYDSTELDPLGEKPVEKKTVSLHYNYIGDIAWESWTNSH